MTIGGLVVGVGNYGFNLALVWLLPGRQFSQVASASTLLLVVGTVSGAAFPLVVARAVSRLPAGSDERRTIIGFSFVGATVLGVLAGGITALAALPYEGAGILLLLVATSTSLLVGSVGSGYLLGAQRFTALAVVAVGEVLLKVGLGVILAVAGAGSTGAFAGSALGAMALAVVAVVVARHDICIPASWPQRSVLVSLGGTASIQTLVVVVTTLDVVVGSIVLKDSRSMAAYQALLVFARVPLFLSTAVSAAVYSRMVGDGEGQSRTASEAMRLCGILAAVVAAAVATLPRALVEVILPRGYVDSVHLLLPLAIAGFCGGLVNLTTTFLQAEQVFASTLRVIAAGVLVTATADGVAAGWSTAGLAWAAAGSTGALAVASVILAARCLGPARLLTHVLAAAALMAVATAGLRALSGHPAIWLPAVCALGVAALAVTRGRSRRPGPLRVVVLRRSPLGGGLSALGLGWLESALAGDGAEVIVTTAGARDRAAAFVRVWSLLWRHQPDLLVEELARPYVGAVGPWWHGGSAVAVVRDPANRHRGGWEGHVAEAILGAYEVAVAPLDMAAPERTRKVLDTALRKRSSEVRLAPAGGAP